MKLKVELMERFGRFDFAAGFKDLLELVKSSKAETDTASIQNFRVNTGSVGAGYQPARVRSKSSW